MQMFVCRKPKLALLDLKTIESEAGSAKQKFREVRRAQVKTFRRHCALLVSKKPPNQTNLGFLAATEPHDAHKSVKV